MLNANTTKLTQIEPSSQYHQQDHDTKNQENRNNIVTGKN